MARLHVDLAARLGHVEVDHAGELGSARAVGHERRLDGVDARRHVERALDVVAPQDADPAHPGSLARGRRAVNPAAGAGGPLAVGSARPRPRRSAVARIATFEMERYQSLHWHRVDHDLSESGVAPMTIRDLLGPEADAEAFLQHALGYPLSEGSEESRRRSPPGTRARREQRDDVNGGSRGELPVAVDAAASEGPARVHGAELHAGPGPRRGLRRRATDTFAARAAATVGGRSTSSQLERRRHEAHASAVMVCNPNNPTGRVLTEAEMDAVVEAAERVGAWIVADEIYRGAEVDTDVTTPDVLGPLRQGDRHERALEGVRDAGAPGRVDRRAARSRSRGSGRRHDYTTLTPGWLSDRARRGRDAAAGAREHLGADPRDHPGEPAAPRGVARGPTPTTSRTSARWPARSPSPK